MLDELKSLLRNPKLIITMIGVSLIPALYNLSFLGSMWDPYGQVRELPVAVVNKDKEREFDNKKLHLGQDLVDRMSKNKALDYHFVSEDKAKKGLEKGDYYMIVTFPEDMSQKSTTLLTPHPEKLIISYQTSKGHGTVASKMNDSAMTKLKEEVSTNLSQSYTKSVFKSMKVLQSGLDQAASGSSQLANGSQNALEGSHTISEKLLALSSGSHSLNQGANQLTSGLVTYTGGVSQLNSGLNLFSNKLPTYLNAVNQLSTGASRLTEGLSQLSEKTSMSSEQSQGIQTLETILPQLNASIQNLNNALNSSQNQTSNLDLLHLSNALDTIIHSADNIISSEKETSNSQLVALQATATYKSLSPNQQAELVNAIRGSLSTSASDAQNISAIASALKVKLSSITTGSQFAQLQTSVNQIAKVSNQALPSASTTLESLSSGLATVNSSVISQLLPGSQQINDGLSTLSLSNATITSSLTQLSNGASQLDMKSSTVIEGSQKLSDGSSDLSEGAEKLSTGSQHLTAGLIELSTGLDRIQDSLGKASQQLNLVSVSEKNARAVVTPVKLTKKDRDGVKNNGIAMAPYMIAVSLMVVALSTNVIFANSLSGKPVKNRWEWAKQKLVINGVISTMGSLVLYGAIQFLGFEANFEMKTLTFIILSGWTLMALVTALVGWDDRYGAFASLLMLLLQVGSSGGSYPIELSSGFFQTLHPYLPMTYVVSGLRETISLSGHSGPEVNVLLGFLVGFMGLALLIYRPKTNQ